MGINSYSVIIPCRPSERFLKEAIESTLSQSLEPTEVIVAINGSRGLECDSSLIATEFGGSVRSVATETSGQIAGINCGIADTKTEFVAFLDADDLWVPTKQEKQLAMLIEFPELEAVRCLATNFQVDQHGVRHEVFTAEAAMFPAVTFRKSSFERFGRLDPTASHFAWHYRWWSNAYEQGVKVGSIGEVGLLRRIHENNSWRESPVEGRAALFAELRSNLKKRRSQSGVEA